MVFARNVDGGGSFKRPVQIGTVVARGAGFASRRGIGGMVLGRIGESQGALFFVLQGEKLRPRQHRSAMFGGAVVGVVVVSGYGGIFIVLRLYRPPSWKVHHFYSPGKKSKQVWCENVYHQRVLIIVLADSSSCNRLVKD